MSYRNCVGALIFNENGDVLICRRASKKKTAVGCYQFPQGGANKDEDLYLAVLREIKEEIGLNPPPTTTTTTTTEEESLTSNIKFISKLQEPLSYDYKFKNSLTKAIGSKVSNIGQLINWHLFYLPSLSIKFINLEFEDKPEFDHCKWYNFNQFINNDNDTTTQPVPFKIEMYKQLYLNSKEIINNYINNELNK